MKDKIIKKTDELKAERNNAISEMNHLKQQIADLNKQGEQLAMHVNVLSGKIEQNEEWLREIEAGD